MTKAEKPPSKAPARRLWPTKPRWKPPGASSYTTIHSPIDGRTGSIAVKQGNVVAANTSDLMTITEVQPIYVTFSVPEAQLSDIKRYMGQGQLRVQAAPQADASRRRPAC